MIQVFITSKKSASLSNLPRVAHKIKSDIKVKAFSLALHKILSAGGGAFTDLKVVFFFLNAMVSVI